MAASLESLGLDRLNADEKLALAGELWDSVLSSAEPGALLTEVQQAELQRRVADAALHPGNSVSWEDALANTLKRLTE